MRISYIKIENFRNFQLLEVDVGQNLVLLGENRSGKSNFIHALRLVLDPSLPDQDRYLVAQDFWDGVEAFKGNEIKITVRLTDFADNNEPDVVPLSWLSSCLIPQGSEPTAQLTYVYFNEKNMLEPQNSGIDDYEFRIYAGDDLTQNFNPIKGMRKDMPLHVINALRDIAGDAQSWRRSPLRRLVELSGITSDVFESIADEIQKLNEVVVDSSAISTLQNDIQIEFDKMVGKICNSSPTLSLSSVTAIELMRSLTLYMDGDKRRDIDRISLGIQNALYLTLLSLLLDKQEVIVSRQKQQFLPIVALEEPEAHLHPHLQRLIFGHFLSKARKRKQPVIVSTHSPQLAITSDLRDVVLFKDNCASGARGVSAFSFLDHLTPRQRNDLTRFLDITKAEMLFCKGVIFVEGDVELLLLKEFADILDIPLDRLGISVCNVSGTHFVHVALLAKQFEIPFVIVTDGDKYATVTGLDRSMSIVEEVFPDQHAELEKLKVDSVSKLEARLREIGIYLNSWTLEVELIEAGNQDIMKLVFGDLGDEIDTKVHAGIDHIEAYDLSPTDENMKKILNAIADKRWGKGRYAHRLLGHIRDKAERLDSDKRLEMVPKYIRDSINHMVSTIEHIYGTGTS